MRAAFTLDRVGRSLLVIGRTALVVVGLALHLLAALVLGAVALVAWLVPRIERATRRGRKRARRRLRRAFRRARAYPVRTALAGAMLVLLTVNGTIRWVGGGDPALLSTRFLPHKVEALGRLVLHLPRHPFGRCRGSQDDLLAEAAGRHRIPVALIEAVARTESGFAPHAISHAGAMGVMQLIPSTARSMEVGDPFDPADSIEGGARYLGQLWRRYHGDVERVAAAYHAGPGAVPVRGPLRVGPTTRRYLRTVARRYRALAALATSEE